MVSMPRDTDRSPAHFPDYVYPPKLHEEVFIYHAELGINQQHQEFSGRRIEWLYPNRTKFRNQDKEEESPLSRKPGHSTCTASKATGNQYGAAKYATLVVVKMSDLTPGSVGEVFATISDHIKFQNRQGRSVVTVSWGSKEEFQWSHLHRRHWSRISDDIIELSKTHTSIMFAAGNAARKIGTEGKVRLQVDTAPATLATNLRRTFVVSNSDLNGRRWSTSQSFGQGKLNPPIYAPGVNVICARHDSNSAATRRTGTSYCEFSVAFGTCWHL